MSSLDSDSNMLRFFAQKLTSRQRLTTWLASGTALALLGTTVVLVATAQAGRNTKLPAARLLPVTTFAAESSDGYRFERDYAGEIVARRAADLGFEQPGRVVDLLVDDGDRVAADQVLARLDTRNLVARRDAQRAQLAAASARLDELVRGPRGEVIEQARAEVQRAEADYKNWNRKLEKREDLFGKGIAAEEEFDDALYATRAAEATLQAAKQRLAELENGTRVEQVAAQRANVAQLEASLQDTEVLLDKATLRAPFAGQIARRSIDEGRVVSAGTTILRIVEDEELEARIGVPGKMAHLFAGGDQHPLRVGSLKIPATVRAVLPEVDASTRTVTVVFSLQMDAATTRPRPGQIARLAWPTPVESQGFWVPLAALTKGARGLWSCYVTVPSDGDWMEVERRPLEVLHIDNERAYVRGVLQNGDQVVAGGVERIVPGQRVAVSNN